MRLGGGLRGDAGAPRTGALKLAVPRGALFEGTLDLLDRIGIGHRRAARRLALAGLRRRRAGAGDDAPLRRPHLRRGRRRRPRDHRQGRAARAARPRRLRAPRPRLRRLPDGARRRAGATRAWARRSAASGRCGSRPSTRASAERYFEETGRQAEVIEVKGSVELAPLVGLADGIVDLVDTGPDAGRERARGARGDRPLHRAPGRQPGRPQAARRRGRRAGRAAAGGEPAVRIERMRVGRRATRRRSPPGCGRWRRPLGEVTGDVARIVERGSHAAATRRCASSPSASARQPPESLRVDPEAIAAAPGLLEPEVREALRVAAAQHRRGGPRRARGARAPGHGRAARGPARSRSREEPVAAAGVYAPGGQGGLSVLGADVLRPGARRRGRAGRASASPPGAGGRPDAAVLAACAIAGVDEVYAVGGAQAIAALAFGTETIAPVDLVAGPGNRYVTEAKRLVSAAGRDRRDRGPERADGRRRRDREPGAGSRSTSAPRPSTATTAR